MPQWILIRDPKYSAKTDFLKARKTWMSDTEARFRNWAKGKNVDYLWERNFYQLVRKAFFYLLRDGEYFVLCRYMPTRSSNPLQIQIIPPENIAGGAPIRADSVVLNGIEYDSGGRAIAYFVRDDRTFLTKRIPKYGPKSGKTFMLHTYLRDNENQRRGIPILARNMTELTKLADYEQLELQAALINALFAVWVEPPADSNGRPTIPKGIMRKNNEATETSIVSDWKAKVEELGFNQGGIIVDQLPAGHKLTSFDTKRPSAGFGTFCSEVRRNISAANNIPLSIIDLQFNNSYSGARGELLIFWNTVETLRYDHSNDLCNELYMMWLYGEIDAGRISAPGWEIVSVREAWSNALWIGSTRPDIDPLKSVQAHIKEHDRGYKTGQEIAAERGGGDYDDNLEVIRQEFEILAQIQGPYNQAIKGGGEQDGGGDYDDKDIGDNNDQ
jgi:lambda family phage portal protein